MNGATYTGVAGLTLTGQFQFEGKTEGGKRVAVSVPKEVVLLLAGFMDSTDSVGHAVWHLQHPDEPPPCSMCGIKSGGSS